MHDHSPGRRASLRMLACSLLPGASVATPAISYPDKPVQIIVGVQPGGATDVTARALGQKLGERLGHPFVIHNKPGAATRLSVDALLQSKPDGHTLGLLYGIVGLYPLMFDNQPPLEPGKDFETVSMVARAPSFLTVNASAPIQTGTDFVAYAKRRDGKLTFGHSGQGSTPSLAAMALLKHAGISGTGVTYKGNGPTALAVATGEIDFALLDYGSVQGLQQRGSVRLVAVTEPQRSPLQPDVPTAQEQGLSSVADGVTPWFLLAAPAGTPASVINLLNQHVVEVLRMPEIVQKLRLVGVDTLSSTPAEAASYFISQRQKMTDLVRKLGVSLKQS